MFRHVTISEHLTSENLKFFQDARKSQAFDSVWSFEANFFGFIGDKRIPIRCENDFLNLPKRPKPKPNPHMEHGPASDGTDRPADAWSRENPTGFNANNNTFHPPSSQPDWVNQQSYPNLPMTGSYPAASPFLDGRMPANVPQGQPQYPNGQAPPGFVNNNNWSDLQSQPNVNTSNAYRSNSNNYTNDSRRKPPKHRRNKQK